MNKATLTLFVGAVFLSACSVGEALLSAVKETPDVGKTAGDAVEAGVNAATSGEGVAGTLGAVGSVLATTLAGIALRAMNKMKNEPSRATPEVAALRERVAKLEGKTE